MKAILNLRIQDELFQHQLHLVCHIQNDDILVDFARQRVMMDEQFQLNYFDEKIILKDNSDLLYLV